LIVRVVFSSTNQHWKLCTWDQAIRSNWRAPTKQIILRPMRGTSPLTRERASGYFAVEACCERPLPTTRSVRFARNAINRIRGRASEDVSGTSVLEPVFYGEHEHHEASLDLLTQISEPDACCGAHGLVEVCSSMIWMPGRHRVGAETGIAVRG
jgi:hypothetical protein